ncbi:MAG TPA: hypothetical protein VEV82_01710 [Actinomycetota bacterium]|nr:hypothetical protein [Actinomycetota bacterium]
MTESFRSAYRRDDPLEQNVEGVEVHGDATTEERAAIAAALEQMIATERRAKSTSVWLRSARAQGRRLGMSDYRDRFSREDAWRLSTRFPFGGREYPGLVGRGDAK